MSIYSFKLPDIGEGIAEAEIVAWHVAVGDVVEEDAPLADVMTDKATVEMTAPVSGKVIAIHGTVGDQIAIGSILAQFEVEGAALEAAQVVELDPKPEVAAEEDLSLPISVASAADTSNDADKLQPVSPLVDTKQAFAEREHVFASPAVRARARDLGIDLTQVKPAESGRTRHADLDAFLMYNRGNGYRPVATTRPDEQIRVLGMRRRIAENMAASKRHIPHFTYVEEMEVSKLEDLRADLNATRGSKPRLTLLPLLITAICKVIPQYPMINARYDDEAGVVTRSGAVHLGMATQTDAGLMVPVIRNAESRNIWQLATEIGRLADVARSGKAKIEELSASTLTITSLGSLGGIATTPVINRPEVAIIGPNKVVERPVFRDGIIVAAKKMNLSISCDHRVVDGWDAASFVQALKRLIETPALLFAD
jgi:2-oxoisovalerate dehydrogenase E2 component (dihydrolipoyl transacylase)